MRQEIILTGKWRLWRVTTLAAVMKLQGLNPVCQIPNPMMLSSHRFNYLFFDLRQRYQEASSRL